jgi:hypothetical protein
MDDIAERYAGIATVLVNELKPILNTQPREVKLAIIYELFVTWLSEEPFENRLTMLDMFIDRAYNRVGSK